MKRIHVGLMVLTTAVMSGGIGFLGGTVVGKTVWTIGDGVPMGVCLTSEIAKQQGAMTPTEIDRVLNQAREKVQQTANQVIPFAEFNFNCPNALSSFSK
ncbi:hypothetical protein [Scytonema sp. PCC 10023]|uniref:hypothetical protein n=1 Tax=Scytonema sp. PCC 10023 TaxID=1680591 RepID=UPI0039C6EA4B